MEYKATGRLKNVGLIFPNIEFRLIVGTSRGTAINTHFLVSPDDPDHVDQIKRFLKNFSFEYGKETYRCEREDLILLGRACCGATLDEKQALSAGTNQFKISLDQLRGVFRQNEWALQNILVAVSGNGSDGTSGLQQDATFAATRIEIERVSHIIFSSNPKQREFWLGKGRLSTVQLEEMYDGRKPCLHGCDAHEQAAVANPALNRYSWIKGDLTFESLRQACIEPDGRVCIAENCPTGGTPSQIIRSVHVSDAAWLETSCIQLNSGLIAVIGARGSGKTALADLVAVGGYSALSQLNERSFIHRANELFTDETATLVWGAGESTSNGLRFVEIEELLDVPRVQYLSQQFVEDLCTAEGPTDKLMEEIERVIFQAHKLEDRMGAGSFRELLDLRSAQAKASRDYHEKHLSALSDELNSEREKIDSLPALKKQLREKERAIENDKKDRQSLVGKGKEERATKHGEVALALDSVRAKLEAAKRRQLALKNLQEEIKNIKASVFPQTFRKLHTTHAAALLDEDQWNKFHFQFAGDVDAILKCENEKVDLLVKSITGTAISAQNSHVDSLIPTGVPLNEQTFELLSAELARLQQLIGVDNENAKKYARISQKIAKDEAEKAKLQRDIEAAEKASGRIKDIIDERKKAYRAVLEAIQEEENQLKALYQPLMKHLQAQEGTVGKLSFIVQRRADIKSWSERGESLLDLRKAGPFKGKGALLTAVQNELQVAWEKGNSDEIVSALNLFREKYDQGLLEHSQVEKSDRPAFRSWANNVADWLYGTAHITVKYGIQHEGVDIKQLSPGTRGIVLLSLYLLVDKEDDRPLIIDQPEENLDPKSIFDELVPLFKSARKRRQIIIVTHNANLVVNTDADQIIIASCGKHQQNQLPKIRYFSGGLENPEIRRKVCEILEGGEAAFKERAKRLRVKFEYRPNANGLFA